MVQYAAFSHALQLAQGRRFVHIKFAAGVHFVVAASKFVTVHITGVLS